MILAGADGIVKGLDPVALGYQSQDAKDELTFPLNLNAVLDGLEKDNEYLAPAFPPKLIELWTKGEARRGRVRLQRADPAGVRAVFLALGRKIRKSSKTTGGAASPSRFCFLCSFPLKTSPPRRLHRRESAAIIT